MNQPLALTHSHPVSHGRELPTHGGPSKGPVVSERRDGSGEVRSREVAERPVLLHVAEAARLLAIGTTLAYELIGQGKLPHVRLGRAVRVPRRALETFIETNTLGTPGRAGTRP